MDLGLASNFEDEYQNIEGLWKIFGPVVEQWLVVDSGSKDNTEQKLREIVGDKLVFISDPMIKTHGFAYARTKLVELSEGMDWVFTIDGDDRMCPDDAKKMKDIIDEDPPYDIIWLPRIDCHDREMRWIELGASGGQPGPDKFMAIANHPDWQPKLIRRTMVRGQSKVHFKRAVHEIPMHNDPYPLRELRDLGSPIIEAYGRLKTLETRLRIRQVCRDLRDKFPEDFRDFEGEVHDG